DAPAPGLAYRLEDGGLGLPGRTGQVSQPVVGVEPLVLPDHLLPRGNAEQPLARGVQPAVVGVAADQDDGPLRADLVEVLGGGLPGPGRRPVAVAHERSVTVWIR